MERKKVTVRDLLALKGQRKIINSSVMDVSMAAIIDASDVDMTGAGATVAAMVIQGHSSPIPATLDQVLLYLLIESPRRLCPPGRDVRPRDHRSSSISMLGITRQGAAETASPCGISFASSTGR